MVMGQPFHGRLGVERGFSLAELRAVGRDPLLLLHGGGPQGWDEVAGET